MEVVDYYYKLLEIPKDSSKEDIYNAYKIKIEKYRNLPFLNTAQKNEIKDLKKGELALKHWCSPRDLALVHNRYTMKNFMKIYGI